MQFALFDESTVSSFAFLKNGTNFTGFYRPEVDITRNLK